MVKGAPRVGLPIAVELSSVNRKQLDIQVALPRGLQAFESSMHTLIRDLFSRGRIRGAFGWKVSKDQLRGLSWIKDWLPHMSKH